MVAMMNAIKYRKCRRFLRHPLYTLNKYAEIFLFKNDLFFSYRGWGCLTQLWTHIETQTHTTVYCVIINRLNFLTDRATKAKFVGDNNKNVLCRP